MTLKEYDAIIEQSKKTILNSIKEQNLTDDDVANWLQYFNHTLANYTGMEKIAGVFDRAESIVRNSIWIPVTERLPENHGLYLVTLNRKTIHINVLRFYSKKCWEKFNVTAWMPLPKPYEEKSND